jgi:hypothetical protein
MVFISARSLERLCLLKWERSKQKVLERCKNSLTSCVYFCDCDHKVDGNLHSAKKKCDYGVGLSRMMNGNVVASERPGHSIFEGHFSSHCSDLFNSKLTHLSWLPSAQSSWSRSRAISIQFSSGSVWMVSKGNIYSIRQPARFWIWITQELGVIVGRRECYSVETITQHPFMLNCRDKNHFKGVGRKRNPWSCSRPCYRWKGCRRSDR